MIRLIVAGLVAVAIISTFGLLFGGLILFFIWRLGRRAVRRA